MEKGFDLVPLIDKDIQSPEFAKDVLHPAISYRPDNLIDFGKQIEKKRLDQLESLVDKRKLIRDIAIRNINDLIVYCDNKIMEIGDKYSLRASNELKQLASKWQLTIVELEKAKIGEKKEMFRDALFLRNEWIKSYLNLIEEKELSKIMGGLEDELMR